MKRNIITYFILLSIMLITSCQEKPADLATDPAPFENAEWVFYNEVTAEHDILHFGEDGSFSYHCDCGDPVGDSDLYDRFRYDEDKLLITLYNDYDEKEKEIKLLSYNVCHLLLEIDGVIRDFSTIETDTTSNFWSEQAESYLSGYEMKRTMVEFTEEGIMTAAVNYDTETKAPKGTLEEYTLAEDALFFDLNIFSQRKIENEAEIEEYYDAAFTEISRTELEYYFDNGGATAYLWLNEEMEIEKVVLWGMTTVTE